MDSILRTSKPVLTMYSEQLVLDLVLVLLGTGVQALLIKLENERMPCETHIVSI